MNWKTGLKYYLIFSAAMAPVVIILAATGVLRTEGGSGSADDEQQPVAVAPAFFGSEHMPNFVGSSLIDSMLLLDEEFGYLFDEIRNLDDGESVSSYFRSRDDRRQAEELFVCSQNVAPGADPADYVLQLYLKIEVSSLCAGKEADFHMGPSARALGVWSPLPFNGTCNQELRNCEDTLQVDGIFVGFLDDDSWNAHKTAIIRTGVGLINAELAWIEPASEWCGYNAPQNGDLVLGAIGARDQLLKEGQLIRMVRTPDLREGLWFFHRLTSQGELQDGQVPELSVNEQLVATGFWIPEASEMHHAYDDYFQPIAERKWEVRSSYLEGSDALLFAYAQRLTNAANLAFASPNEFLGSCITDQQDELGPSPSYANSDDDDDDNSRTYVGNSGSDDSDGTYTLNCEGDNYYDFPQLCDGGERLLSEMYDGTGPYGGLGGGSGGSSLDSPSSSCTYVSGYTRRDGTRVSGYWRGCG
jgi:hypothetical protein